MTVTIGVLSVQGDVAENITAVRQAMAEADVEGTVNAIRMPGAVSQLDGLVIPGGESTSIGKLSEARGLIKEIQKEIRNGMPVLGVCAGMILLSKSASDPVLGDTEQPLLGLLDVEVQRNSFGRQRRSFEASVSMNGLGIFGFNGVFIRAPSVSKTGPSVEVLAKLDGKIVAVRSGNIVGTSFHPELSGDASLHRHLAEAAAKYAAAK